jgi:SAM-dependent methyltransferase
MKILGQSIDKSAINKRNKILGIIKKDLNYTVQNRAFCFVPGERKFQKTAGVGLLGKIQNVLKRRGAFYYFLLKTFAPVYGDKSYRKKILQVIEGYDESHIILNLGSGPVHYKKRTDIINVDLFAFDEVDIVADCVSLPIENGAVDMIVNVALLEHVKNPEAVVHEMFRILKADGVAICFLPFMQPFHAAPHDYQRWTLPGIRMLFRDFGHIEAGIAAGPTSGMLWVFQEWASILLSFGSRTLHDIVFMLLMLITFPVKYMDILITRYPDSEKIASGFYVIARK